MSTNKSKHRLKTVSTTRVAVDLSVDQLRQLDAIRKHLMDERPTTVRCTRMDAVRHAVAVAYADSIKGKAKGG